MVLSVFLHKAEYLRIRDVPKESFMSNLREAMNKLCRGLSEEEQHPPIPFEEYVKLLVNDPIRQIRNVFQAFYDMIHFYIGEGEDEYPDDPESIHYVDYDCYKLFVEELDHPFFADRLFANRLVNLVEALRVGAQQNKIYVFEGPHGSGKSTFLNNLLLKFENYVNSEEGTRYETVWRFKRKGLGPMFDNGKDNLLEKLQQALGRPDENVEQMAEASSLPAFSDEYIEVPCPSHDNPILMIPKHYRRQFFDDVFENDEFKWKLFTEKEYEWVFHDTPCTICSSLYDSMLMKFKNPLRVLGRLYARPYRFNRRVGEGVSVFSPGDKPIRHNVITNPLLQRGINGLFNDSNQVKYVYSRYAKTNNGVYALMDIKGHNTERMIELHNIISEGVHKVDDIEESVNSLLFALMNPEDKKNIGEFQSFSDRIEYIKIPYVLDLKTEIQIYRNIFGKHIDASFLPWVMHNFARVIIASRLNKKSEAMLEWIEDPKKYSMYCDENLHLLKMEIYTGYIPNWLSEEDRKRLNAKRRRRIIDESEKEGGSGFSGRDSIKIFHEFYSTYAKSDRLITMSMVCKFFEKHIKDKSDPVPKGFLDSVVKMYNYKILHEVKEALYYYNEEQIARDIQNYIFAVNFELGAKETCKFTGDNLEITEEFLSGIESRLLGEKADRPTFRKDTQKTYTTVTLTQEMMQDGKDLAETKLFEALHDKYVYNLKEKVLDPFLKNENFRRAIKDYKSEAFKTYDKKIRNDVTFLLDNLCTKSRYNQQGAQEVCIYVIDNKLAEKF